MLCRVHAGIVRSGICTQVACVIRSFSSNVRVAGVANVAHSSSMNRPCSSVLKLGQRAVAVQGPSSSGDHSFTVEADDSLTDDQILHSLARRKRQRVPKRTSVYSPNVGDAVIPIRTACQSLSRTLVIYFDHEVPPLPQNNSLVLREVFPHAKSETLNKCAAFPHPMCRFASLVELPVEVDGSQVDVVARAIASRSPSCVMARCVSHYEASVLDPQAAPASDSSNDRIAFFERILPCLPPSGRAVPMEFVSDVALMPSMNDSAGSEDLISRVLSKVFRGDVFADWVVCDRSNCDIARRRNNLQSNKAEQFLHHSVIPFLQKLPVGAHSVNLNTLERAVKFEEAFRDVADETRETTSLLQLVSWFPQFIEVAVVPVTQGMEVRIAASEGVRRTCFSVYHQEVTPVIRALANTDTGVFSISSALEQCKQKVPRVARGMPLEVASWRKLLTVDADVFQPAPSCGSDLWQLLLLDEEQATSNNSTAASQHNQVEFVQQELPGIDVEDARQSVEVESTCSAEALVQNVYSVLSKRQRGTAPCGELAVIVRWAERYSKQHGAFLKFLRRHPEDFETFATTDGSNWWVRNARGLCESMQSGEGTGTTPTSAPSSGRNDLASRQQPRPQSHSKKLTTGDAYVIGQLAAQLLRLPEQKCSTAQLCMHCNVKQSRLSKILQLNVNDFEVSAAGDSENPKEIIVSLAPSGLPLVSKLFREVADARVIDEELRRRVWNVAVKPRLTLPLDASGVQLAAFEQWIGWSRIVQRLGEFEAFVKAFVEKVQGLQISALPSSGLLVVIPCNNLTEVEVRSNANAETLGRRFLPPPAPPIVRRLQAPQRPHMPVQAQLARAEAMVMAIFQILLPLFSSNECICIETDGPRAATWMYYQQDLGPFIRFLRSLDGTFITIVGRQAYASLFRISDPVFFSRIVAPILPDQDDESVLTLSALAEALQWERYFATRFGALSEFLRGSRVVRCIVTGTGSPRVFLDSQGPYAPGEPLKNEDLCWNEFIHIVRPQVNTGAAVPTSVLLENCRYLTPDVLAQHFADSVNVDEGGDCALVAQDSGVSMTDDPFIEELLAQRISPLLPMNQWISVQVVAKSLRWNDLYSPRFGSLYNILFEAAASPKLGFETMWNATIQQWQVKRIGGTAEGTPEQLLMMANGFDVCALQRGFDVPLFTRLARSAIGDRPERKMLCTFVEKNVLQCLPVVPVSIIEVARALRLDGVAGTEVLLWGVQSLIPTRKVRVAVSWAGVLMLWRGTADD